MSYCAKRVDRVVIRYSLVLLTLLNGVVWATPEEERRITDSLEKIGRENVSVEISETQLRVWCENRIMRYPVASTWLTVTHLARLVPSEWTVILTVLKRNRPIVRITARATEVVAWADGDLSSKRLGEHADVQLAFDDWPPADKNRRSEFRSDVIIGPNRIISEFGLPKDWIRANVDLSGEWRASPWTGGIVSARILIPLWQHNGPVELRNREVRPGSVYAGWVTAPTPTSMLTITTGFFERGFSELDAFGFIFDYRMFTPDGRWTVGGMIARVGRLSYTVIKGADGQLQGVWGYTQSLFNMPFELHLGKRFEVVDFLMLARWGRFYRGDHGWRVDMVRRFGEVQWRIFGLMSDGRVRGYGSLNDTRLLGGIGVSMPVWPRAHRRPARLRVVPMPALSWAYRYRTSFAGVSLSTGNSIGSMLAGYLPTELENNLDRVRQWIHRDSRLTGPRNPDR